MKNRGFTIIELLLVLAISTILLGVVADLVKNTFSLNRRASGDLSSYLDARRAFKTFASEVRSADSITATSSESISILIDLDGNGVPDSVRYYLDTDKSFKRDASGSISIMATSLENSTSTPLFGYQSKLIKIILVLRGETYSSGVTPRQ